MDAEKADLPKSQNQKADRPESKAPANIFLCALGGER
jgi:hypothetical protein